MSEGNCLIDLMVALRDREEAKALSLVSNDDLSMRPDLRNAIFRHALQYDQLSPSYFRKLANVWNRSGKQSLKPNPKRVKIEILSDATVTGLEPYLSLFFASYGILAEIEFAEFDSIEHVAYGDSEKGVDLCFVIISDQWILKRCNTAIGTTSEDLKAELEDLVSGLHRNRSGQVVMTSVNRSAWSAGGAFMQFPGSRDRLTIDVNEHLNSLVSERLSLIDVETVVNLGGGVSALGQLSLIRMRSPMEQRGLIALARELASACAHLLGRSHRALLTDWDNTLWGGEVGELGFHGIVCGQESPDGFGYFLLQSYMRELTGRGILLAGVSRNDPSMASVLNENKHLVLKDSHFASLAINWGSKSDSVQAIEKDLNFGTDLMVFVDDNHADIVDVVLSYPSIDFVLAGPEPDQTLTRLAHARFFNAARVGQSDLKRSDQAQALKAQRVLEVSSNSPVEFRKSLDINVVEVGYTDVSRERVLQLLQKTNQFNVTSYRHGRGDLDRLLTSGARIGVFDYSDRFGPQGIVCLMILVPESESVWVIDTWLMSCRVLNRGVEDYALEWAKTVVQSGRLKGTYIPSAKNALVCDLFDRMGFDPQFSTPDSHTYSLDLTKV